MSSPPSKKLIGSTRYSVAVSTQSTSFEETIKGELLFLDGKHIDQKTNFDNLEQLLSQIMDFWENKIGFPPQSRRFAVWLSEYFEDRGFTNVDSSIINDALSHVGHGVVLTHSGHVKEAKVVYHDPLESKKAEFHKVEESEKTAREEVHLTHHTPQFREAKVVDYDPLAPPKRRTEVVAEESFSEKKHDVYAPGGHQIREAKVVDYDPLAPPKRRTEVVAEESFSEKKHDVYAPGGHQVREAKVLDYDPLNPPKRRTEVVAEESFSEKQHDFSPPGDHQVRVAKVLDYDPLIPRKRKEPVVEEQKTLEIPSKNRTLEKPKEITSHEQEEKQITGKLIKPSEMKSAQEGTKPLDDTLLKPTDYVKKREVIDSTPQTLPQPTQKKQIFSPPKPEVLPKPELDGKKEQKSLEPPKPKIDETMKKTESKKQLTPKTIQTDFEIEIDDSEPEEETPQPKPNKHLNLEDISGIGEKNIELLKEAGFETVEKVATATSEELCEIKGIGPATAKKLITSAKELL